jgi:hypothetical protein
VELNQEVCTRTTEGKLTACGNIVKTQGNKAAIKVLKLNKKRPPLSGDEFSLRDPERKTAATPREGLRVRAPKSEAESEWSIVAGPHMGLSYLYSMLHLEYEWGDGLVVGALPLFYFQKGSDSQAVGFGGFATVAYDFDGVRHQGWGVVGGAGVYSLALQYEAESESVLLWAGMAQLSYRWLFRESGLMAGINAGGQYIIGSSTTVDFSFTGIQPLLAVYGGFVF